MDQNHLDCYRINYRKKDWMKHSVNGRVNLPDGILCAVEALCNEVERLNKKGAKCQKKGQ